MAKKRENQDRRKRDRDIAARLYLNDTHLPRGALPYSPDFDRLWRSFKSEAGRRVSKHEFWRLLDTTTKQGGFKTGRRSPSAPQLTNEQELELMRLCPDGLGSRDDWPYTERFEDLYARFTDLTGVRLNKWEFWLVVSNMAKRARKPAAPATPLFTEPALPDALARDLRSINPWWARRPGPKTPPMKRWAFHAVLRKLERPLAPVVALRGPRRVGKTVIQQQIVSHLLSECNVSPTQILRVQWDEVHSLGVLAEPILDVLRWFEKRVLGRTFNEAARASEPAYLFFDEIQNLKDWDSQLKFFVDHHDARVFVTGSSSLRIALGRDSLAGRITELDLGPLRLSEVAELRELPPLSPPRIPNGNGDLLRADFWRELVDHAQRQKETIARVFPLFAERGGYPEAHSDPNIPWPELADYLNRTVIQRAVRQDLRARPGTRNQNPEVLEACFRLACRYTGQAVRPKTLATEISEVLGEGIAPVVVRDGLDFLEQSMLIRLVPPLEVRLKRARGPHKICVCDHGLRAAVLQESVPLTPEALGRNPSQSDVAGHIAEGILGYFLAGTPGVQLAYFPARKEEPEVDLVMTIGIHHIPIEVKYRRVLPPDALHGLRSFVAKEAYEAPFGIVITRDDTDAVQDDVILQVPFSAALLLA
jgi:hypothetical protein